MPSYQYRLLLSEYADELVEFDVRGRPGAVVHYSVVLRYLPPSGKPVAVRVFDNSHAPDEHHMHRCDSRGNRRQPPEVLQYAHPFEALFQARKLVEHGLEEMIAGWRR